MACPKCGATSGGDWSQCEGKCPMPNTPHYDWQTEADHKVKNVAKSHDGQGYNFQVAAARKDARVMEAHIMRLKPHIEELIDNCKANGYWETTKQGTLARIAAEMIDMSGTMGDEPRKHVQLTLKRIKADKIKW